MRADTFAKLVTLETLVDAEIGFFLEHPPASADRFREAMVARISDLVDEIDQLDAVAAARVYDTLVDFLSELPDDPAGVVESTLRFKRALDRVADRAMEPRDLAEPATWAFALDELLEVLAVEYAGSYAADGPPEPRGYLRARLLVHRAREAAERMAWEQRADRRAEVRDHMDRLVLAILSQRPRPGVVDGLVRAAQKVARRYRPSNLTRIGTFVVGQLLRRRDRGG